MKDELVGRDLEGRMTSRMIHYITNCDTSFEKVKMRLHQGNGREKEKEKWI